MRLFVALATCSTALMAAPPAPMMPDTTRALQSYIRAVEAKDIAAYREAFAQDVEISDGQGPVADSRVWMRGATDELSRASVRVNIQRVFYGSERSGSSAMLRVVLLEQIHDCESPVLECFPMWQIETLTFDSTNHIRVFNRSTRFLTELSTSGYRTDLQR